MNGPLADKPTLRKRVYAAFWTLGITIGGTQVAYASVDAGTPNWMKAALAVYAFLGGAIGYTAAQNTPAADEVDEELLEEPEFYEDIDGEFAGETDETL